MAFTSLAIDDPAELIFGRCPRPVRSPRGLLIGGGLVYPELNFTLPQMAVNAGTMPEVRDQYRSIANDALERAVDLHAGGLILEFETLLEMTLNPAWGVELVEIMNEICESFHARHGLKSEIRLTPNDTRDFERPARMRSSVHLENMFRLFEGGARAGGTFLSIESTGGKEVHDEALMNCDIAGVLFALAVLGVRDMRFLWERIMGIARSTGALAGGDTACGFANTAMVLAEKKYIPRVFAALVRVISVPRTLAAVEAGAGGPDKDCGYEGPYLKAVAGIPISMEGKSAACAHLSPVGNVAAACCDLWSNESVQNVKLLGAMAPIVSLEQLVYDCRLMNAALGPGRGASGEDARLLRRLLIDSDAHLDPQAFVLDPNNVVPIASALVSGTNPVDSSIRAALAAVELMKKALDEGRLRLDERERPWLDSLGERLAGLPRDEDGLTALVQPTLDPSKVILSEYGL